MLEAQNIKAHNIVQADQSDSPVTIYAPNNRQSPLEINGDDLRVPNNEPTSPSATEKNVRSKHIDQLSKRFDFSDVINALQHDSADEMLNIMLVLSRATAGKIYAEAVEGVTLSYDGKLGLVNISGTKEDVAAFMKKIYFHADVQDIADFYIDIRITTSNQHMANIEDYNPLASHDYERGGIIYADRVVMLYENSTGFYVARIGNSSSGSSQIDDYNVIINTPQDLVERIPLEILQRIQTDRIEGITPSIQRFVERIGEHYNDAPIFSPPPAPIAEIQEVITPAEPMPETPNVAEESTPAEPVRARPSGGAPPVNEAPVAVDDAYNTTLATALVIDATNLTDGLLDNDTDAEGDALSVSSIDAISLQGGTIIDNLDGTYSYTPPATYAGNDSFSYSITDGSGIHTATVTISVSDNVGLTPSLVDVLVDKDVAGQFSGLAADWHDTDTIIGGAGQDVLTLTAGAVNAMLDGVNYDNIQEIEQIIMQGDAAHNLVVTDDYFDRGLGLDGDKLTVDASAATSSNVTIDGSAATAPHSFDIRSGGGDDTLKTGAGDDTVVSSAGADTIETGAGDDEITMSWQTTLVLSTPDAIAGGNLLMWFDANDLDSDGVSEGLAESGLSGTLVDQWTDKSGNGNHAASPSAGERPSFNLANQDIDFNNTILDVGNAGDFEHQEFTIVAVGHWNASNTWRNTFASVGGESGRGWQLRQRSNDVNDVTFTVRGTSGGDDPNPTNITTNTDFIAIGGFSDSLNDRGIWANGSSTYFNGNDNGDIDYNGTSPFAIGGRYTPGKTRALNGGIKELLYFDKYLSDSERTALEGYLAHKWGTDAKLPAPHAHKGAAPSSTTIDSVVDGGAGQDILKVTSGVIEVTLDNTSTSITAVETFDLRTNDAAHKITITDDYYTNGAGINNDLVTIDVTGNNNGVSIDGNALTGSNTLDIKASNGNDTISAGAGNDTITGADGDDSIEACNGNNSITGGIGNDTIVSGAGNDTVDAGDGSDHITTGAGNDTIEAGTGADIIASGAGDDVITINAVAAPYSPLAIGNVTMWFDADDLDGDGIVEGLAESGLSGTLVDQWTDKSGNGNHAASPSAGERPSFNLVNQDIDFNNTILDVGNAGDFEHQEFTIVAVGHWNASNTWRNTFASVGGESGRGWQLRQRSNIVNDVTFTVRGTSGGDDPNPTNITTNTDFIAIGGFSDSLNSRGIWANGTSTYFNGNDNNAITYNGTSPFAIGGRYTPGKTRALNGGIKELIYFDKYLSDAERIALEGYLAHKWGTDAKLPAPHAHKAGPPPSTIDDIVNGGAGDDTLHITGDAQTLTLGGSSIRDIETLDFTANDNVHNISITDSYYTDGTGIVDDEVHLDFTGNSAGVTVDGSELTGTHKIDVDGSEGNDTLSSGDAGSTLNGNGGDDHIHGGEGSDTIMGGAGNDVITALNGNNLIDGGDGNDSIIISLPKGAKGAIFDTTGTVNSLATAKALMVNPPDATFDVTRIDYNGGNVQSFLALGGDDGSLTPAAFGTAALDRIVFHISGFIQVDTAGTYNFRVSSDDGFELKIDGAVISQYDGGRSFAPTTQSAAVSAGIHSFELLYYEGTGGQGLRFETDLGGSYEIVDDDILFSADVATANDTIAGGAGNDTIDGNVGDDVITGGADQDSMTGGDGDDHFRFTAITDSNAATPDVITDFNQAGDDSIDFSAILGGAGSFIGVGAFTGGGAHEIRAEQSGADTIIQLDLGGTGASDMEFLLSSVTAGTIAVGDFIL